MIKRSAVKNILKPELLSVISDGSTAPSRHGGMEFCAENAPNTEEGCYTATILTHLEIAVPQAVSEQFDGKSFIDARRPREP